MGQHGRGADYEAGLDGLRALAVVAVLLFHSEFGWARGGFLGVSVFFTLSGFLITRVLLGEHERTGRIGLRTFWTRRVRRLAPASLCCLALIALCVPSFAASRQIATVRGDLLAALGYVANWRFVAARQSYADLFVGGPSPVLHFWSLAIEEQFYVVYPCVIAVTTWLAGRLRRAWLVPAALGALAVGSTLAGFATHDRDLYYYGTHTRAVEFLVGALVAWAMVRTAWLPDFLAGPRGRRLAPASAIAALGIGTVLVATTAQNAGWLYAGGFPALALLWSVVIVGAMVPGLVRSLLSRRPVVALGRLSFGVYLFHWPIFQLLTPTRVGTADWRLHLARWTATLAVAGVSYVCIEQPIRTRRIGLRRWRGVAAFAVAMAGVAVLASVVRPAFVDPGSVAMATAPDHAVSFGDTASAAGGAVGAGSTANGVGVAATPAAAVAAPPTLTIVVVGSDGGVVQRLRADLPALGAASAAPAASATPATPGAARFDLVDLTVPGCSFLQQGMSAALADVSGMSCATPNARLADYIRGGGAVDAMVLSFGDADHRAVAERLSRGMADGFEGVALQHDHVVADLAMIGAVQRLLPHGVPIAVVDAATTAPDPLSLMLRELAVAQAEVTERSLDELASGVTADAIESNRRREQADERVRVMVIGDSTSYGIAKQLDDLAGDQYDVVWAGHRNCPFVPATEVRWWKGAEFAIDDCLAAQQEWPQIAADFRPDVLLVVASLPELSDQRYAKGDDWHAIGDPVFEQQHSAALRRLTDLVAPFDAVTLLADAPNSDWTDAGRVAAWNARLGVWAKQLPATSVLRYGEAVEAAETRAGHSLRPDNVHVEDAALRTIVQTSVIPQIDAAVAAHRAS